MSHLTLEALARLVDEPAETTEAVHLRDCAACRDELAAMRQDVAQLGSLAVAPPPAHAWDALEARLVAEGLVRPATRRRRWTGTLMRLAAALVLFVAGASASALLLTGQGGEGPAAGTPPVAVNDAPAEAPGAADPAPTTADTGQPPAGETVSQPALAAAPDPGARLASLDTGRRAAPPSAPTRGAGAYPVSLEPRSVEEAAALLQVAEQYYLSALTRYSELAGQTRAGDPMARLAALEAITLTTRAALGYAPADPFINGYHLSAVAERDATLRQIAATTTNSWF